MKKYYSLFFVIGLLLLGCSKKKLDLSGRAVQDSIPVYLKLANEDSIPYDVRLRYNKKALDVFIKQENDSMNRVNLFKIANRYFNMKNFEEYQKTSRIIVEKAKDQNDTISIAKGYCYLGDYYMNTSGKDSAFFYYTKAEKIYQKKNDKINLAGVYISMAIVRGYEKDFLGSELSVIKALNVLRNTQEKAKIYKAYNLLGVISGELKDYEKAIEYHTKALNLVKDNNLMTFHEEASSLNNIGNVYQNQNKDRLAIEKFQAALKDKGVSADDPNLHAILLDNLAYSKFKLKDFSDLPNLFYESLKIRDSLNLTLGIIHNKIHLSEYYGAVKDTTLAQQFAKEALSLSRKLKSYRDILNSLKQLGTVDPKNTSIYSDEYIKINDSLHFEERKMQNKFARIEYETDEIIIEKDKAVNQKWTALWVSIAALLSGLLFYAFRIQQSRHRELLLLKSRQKANEEIYQLILEQEYKFDEGREKEKRRIAKELHDGIMNRLASIRFNLFVLENKTDPETIAHCINQAGQIREVEKEVRDIAHDLDNDAFSSKSDYPSLLRAAVAEFSHTVSLKADLEIDSTIDWESMDGMKKMNIYRILQESLHNIRKHAQASQARISFLKNSTFLELEINDNGIGFDIQDSSQGQGIRNIGSRVKEIGGSLKISSILGQGTSIRIILSLESN